MPRPSSPNRCAQASDEFDFGRGIGAVAELVLQALDIDAVERAVGQAARHEKARQTAVRLGEHQMRIALRRRKEPLVTRDAVRAVGRAHRTGGIRAHVRAALFFRHAHADEPAALAFDGDVARVVIPGEQPRQPIPGQPCVAAHRGDGAVSHGGRAQRAALHLCLHEISRGARRVRACHGNAAGSRPRSAVISALGNALHQDMPGGMEFDAVDAFAADIEVVQHGRVPVGQTRVLEVLGGPQCRAGGP